MIRVSYFVWSSTSFILVDICSRHGLRLCALYAPILGQWRVGPIKLLVISKSASLDGTSSGHFVPAFVYNTIPKARPWILLYEFPIWPLRYCNISHVINNKRGRSRASSLMSCPHQLKSLLPEHWRIPILDLSICLPPHACYGQQSHIKSCIRHASWRNLHSFWFAQIPSRICSFYISTILQRCRILVLPLLDPAGIIWKFA